MAQTNRLEHKTVVTVDPFRPAAEQKGLMNRWHPDIPAYVTVKPGEVFKVECHEWTGGQISNSDNADDVKNVDLTKIHYLSGPIAIEDITPFEQMQWGYTGVFERTNGGGLFSTTFDTKAAKAIWDFEGKTAAGCVF
ncbi:uncharacterized protein EHS24_007677 [Apiotrichum porosum]|uniref:Formamidase n=1 Tax=Apiotrichum porosum TaxID=105984 RepID=A0A427XV23_9TREE|nr:uncharacterized protein EHS24_007677 [Apiotrichum porosum]RSH82683.1 hypothetical protein EHS24_007677 [Apiotrichum porosum]